MLVKKYHRDPNDEEDDRPPSLPSERSKDSPKKKFKLKNLNEKSYETDDEKGSAKNDEDNSIYKNSMGKDDHEVNQADQNT